jgi:uncharacterized protein (TIGR02145 family)
MLTHLSESRIILDRQVSPRSKMLIGLEEFPMNIKTTFQLSWLLMLVTVLCLCIRLPLNNKAIIHQQYNPVVCSAAASYGSVTVVWSDADSATSYDLLYREGSITDTMASWNVLTGVTSPKKVGGLPNGKLYSFAVTVWYGNYISVMGPIDTARTLVAATTGTVTDIDGNVYNTITIGTQVWMSQNLKTTRLNDGTAITQLPDTAKWGYHLAPAYCWYNNDSSTYGNIYGALYNWYAVNTGKLAPTGWHVPTDTDWNVLITYLGGTFATREAIKEPGMAHWITPDTNATNSTGFSALPGGLRIGDGTFNTLGNSGFWWSATLADTADSWAFDIQDCNIMLGPDSYPFYLGLSVRCIRNN